MIISKIFLNNDQTLKMIWTPGFEFEIQEELGDSPSDAYSFKKYYDIWEKANEAVFLPRKINLEAVSFCRWVVLKLCYVFESYEALLNILMSSPQPMSIRSVSGGGSQAAVFFKISQVITMYNQVWGPVP